MSTFFVRWGEEFFEEANYYAGKLLCTPIFLEFTQFPGALVYWNKFSGQLSIDRGFTRLWRACPPLFLFAVFVAEWRAALPTIS